MLTKYLGEADMGMHAPQQRPAALEEEDLAAGSSGRRRQRPRCWRQPSYEGSGLTAAAVVSNPVCMDRSSRNLTRPLSFSFLYNLAIAYK